MRKTTPSNEEAFICLSKNNAKTLLVRNAIDQATLNKEVRQLQKERNSGQRLFLKKKEHLLQRQSTRIFETSQRPLSSLSLTQLAVTKWRNETTKNSLAGRELSSSKLGRKDGNKSQMSLSSSLPLLSEGTENLSRFRPRNKTLSSLSFSHSTTSSLPDIHTASSGTAGKKYTDTEQPRQVSNKVNKEKTELRMENYDIDEWKELRKCRYLRRCSIKKDPR
ncbi:hypothetical protein OS493_030441 [Desmophyllum pertusum]|uniref:Uncharacterized protein n=1 Tax=Desmophyllum pertusum TaxID=174260 RepID=A0A9W9YZY3_9CNID|nr:hypothetical protein OS493_030441 [Desmophyllum pertusum]